MANIENNKKNYSASESIPEKISHAVEDTKNLVKDVVDHPAEVAGEFAEQAKKDVKSINWWARVLLILFWTFLGFITLFFVAINLNVTKRWAATQALEILNKDFKAKMTTKDITVDFFGDVQIKGLTIEDYKGLEFIKIREFRANSDWLQLAKNAISKNNNSLSFNALTLVDADIKVITYKGDSISNFIRYIGNFDSGKKRDPKKPPFQLNSRVQIIDSKVSIINQNSEGDQGKWLMAEHLNLRAPSVKVNGADVFAQVNNLSFTTTRWGKKHRVDTFSTDVSLTKDHLLLQDLTLNTDHSLLQGDLKFNLHDGSWQDFTNKVKWEMNLMLGSQISGYDISYFVTNWDNYKPVNLAGKMTGPLNNFRLDDFSIGNREVSIRTNSIKLLNLLQGNFVIESTNLSTDFTYVGLKQMLPTFISKKMKNFADDFGRLKYNGAIRIMPEQIYVSNANLITEIGRANIKNFYLEDFSSTIPKYKGYAEVFGLNAVAITKNKAVGLITGKFNFDGSSFDVNTMKIKTKSQIASIEIMDKTINNLYLNGVLDRKTYQGIIRVNDEQARANVDGFIDFRTSRLVADVNADIQHLNINYFTGQAGNQILKGSIVGKIAMTNINDLDLNAQLKNLVFSTGNKTFSIPDGNVRAFFENGNRVVAVDAPGVVDGKITGKYNLEDVAGMIQNGLNKILVGPPPKKLYRGQFFNMEFNVKQKLVNYFLPELQLPNGAFVNGSYDGNANNLVLNLDAEQAQYLLTNKQEISETDKALAALNPDYKIDENKLVTQTNALLENVSLRINTANQEEQIFAKIARIDYNKNIFKDVTLTGKNENNQVLRLSANFLHGTPENELNNEMKAYAININQSTNKNGDFVLRFDPTEVNFNNITWKIDTNSELNHSITYRKKTGDFLIENLRLFSDQSEILVKNAVFKSAKDFDAQAEVKNMQLSKLLEMQEGGNSLNIQGVANGTLNIKMNNSNLEPIIDLNIDGITMNGEDLGNVIINAKNSERPNVFDINAKVVSAGIIGDNNLDVTGTIDNNTPSPTLDIKANMKDFDLKFSNQFVKGVFSNMRGKANGILSINGPLKDLNYSGDIALNDFGLKLGFTGVDYSFDDTIVNLMRGAAVLNSIGVSDGRNNSTGTISGAIYFETLSSMAVELIIRANNLMLLNTTQRDFDLFWGRVYGEGDLYVSGPVNALKIATPNMKALNNSVFTFNANSQSSVEEFKMLRFLKEDDKGIVTTEIRKKSGSNMDLDFNVEVDRGTTVNVLVGDGIGDISVRGNSENLGFKMSRQGNITMNGSYFVDNGTFTSKAILNRTFQIEKGSNLRWDGDPMTPGLDITANYMRSVSNAGDYLNVGYLQPINVMLQTKISQTLNNPKIDLLVNALDVSSQIKETLAARMSQEDERVRQFGSILLMNRFNVSNSGGLFTNTDLAGVGEDYGYNLLLKQLGAVLNTISNEFQIDLNYVRGDQASNTGDRANAGVRFALSPRLTVKTGLGIPLSRGAETTNREILSGEGTIEYDVSRKNDGTLILRGYSKPMNIGMGGTNVSGGSVNQTYGAGVVWSKSFNSLFKKSKKNKNRKELKDSVKTDSIKKDSIK